MRRTLLCILAAATSLATAMPAAAAPVAELRDCALTLHVFMDEPDRLQPRFVPARYRPLAWVPGKPYIALWSFACRRDGDPVHLSAATVAVEHPDRPAGTQPLIEMPNLWANYVHRFYTDDRALAKRLRGLGFPTRRTAGMGLERSIVVEGAPPVRALAQTRVAIPGAWSSWTLPIIQHEPPHEHANSFWRDTRRGPAVIDVLIPHAQDHFCELSIGERCGTVDAAPGSDFAEFLGASRRSADAAVDHEPISRVSIAVRP